MGGGVSLLDVEKGVCPNFSVHKKSRGWRLRWFFSSRGKPRSQWVWPTAAHLEPMRLGEDLWREEEKLSQRGTPQRAKHHPSSRVSPRCSWVVYKPTCAAFNLTLNFCPHHHQVENQHQTSDWKHTGQLHYCGIDFKTLLLFWVNILTSLTQLISFFAIFQNCFKLHWLVNSELQIKSNCYFNT